MTFLRIAGAAAAAALILPVSASASQTLGSSLDASRGTVDGVGCNTPCTLVQDAIDGVPLWSDGGVITSWKAVVASGSTARIRVVERHGAGDYTILGSGRTISGNDEVQTVTDHIVIPVNATIGVDVDGQIGGIRSGGQIGSFEPMLDDGASATSDLTDDELLLQATVEPDVDGDGLGDESEDSCVYCETSQPATPSAPSEPSTPAAPQSEGPAPDQYSLNAKALLIRGPKPVVRVYASNGLNDVEGKLTLKVAGKSISKKVWTISGAQDQIDFPISRKLAAKLVKGTPKALVTGTPAVEDAGRTTVHTAVTVLHGVTRAFDGTYRGSGPLVVVVKDGIVIQATKPLLLMSMKGPRSLNRAFFLPEDGPVLLNRAGKVEVSGDWKADTATFKAQFTRSGMATGYLSMWHTELGSFEGRLTTEQYFQASNWTASR